MVELTIVFTSVTVDVTVVKVSWYTFLVKVGVGTCKQLQISDCCALLSPLNCAGWPLLMGTLDVFTELVLEVDFFKVKLLIIFDVVLLIFFDVETGFNEVVILFEVETGFNEVVILFGIDTGFAEVVIFLEVVELGLLVLVVFFELVLTFSVLVDVLLVEVIFFVLDNF
jgi:hypothetical protein